MRRKPGSRPFHVYVDEAGLFPVPELGMALDFCRQRSVGFTLAMQSPFQVKHKEPEIFDAIMRSTGTKLVLKVNSRDDALLMADNIVLGMADPKVKHIQMGVAYRLKDVYLPTLSFQEGDSSGESTGATKTESRGRTTGTTTTKGNTWATALAKGGSAGISEGSYSNADGESAYNTFSDVRTLSRTDSNGTSETGSEHQSSNQTLAVGISSSKSMGKSRTRGISFGPTTTHREVEEEKGRQFFSLEEIRWMESERLMLQRPGYGTIRLPEGFTRIRIPLPAETFTKRERVLAFLETVLREGTPRDEIARKIAARQATIQNTPDDSPRRSPRPKRSPR
jgi:hypothetical protein